MSDVGDRAYDTFIGDALRVGVVQRTLGEWSETTFPPIDGGEWSGTDRDAWIEHLRSEVDELAIALDRFTRRDELPLDEAINTGTDLRFEIADIVMLCLGLAHRERFDLGDYLMLKHRINLRRTWLTERNAQGFRKHVDEVSS